jgi:hypothetical protein
VASTEGDDWATAIAGGSKEVVGQVGTIATLMDGLIFGLCFLEFINAPLCMATPHETLLWRGLGSLHASVAVGVECRRGPLVSSVQLSLPPARAEVRRQISGQVAQPIERTDTNTLVYKVDQACVSMR